MRFTKMQGAGNDYVYVSGFEERIARPQALARAISDRHFGVGADGLVVILPSPKADVRMRMFNADGSEAEMCGNAVRCVAKYAYEHDLSRSNPMRVQTGAGVRTLSLDVSGGKVRQVTVNMGRPVLELADIPVNVRKLKKGSKAGQYRVPLPKGESAQAVFVSMGNPHAVIHASDVESVDIERLGPVIERHAAFPRRINVHWVKRVSPREVVMRTWERGSGVTLACGTGACAVCVTGVITGRTGRRLLAHLPGGDLVLEWREEDGCVYMTGEAVEVFSGDWL